MKGNMTDRINENDRREAGDIRNQFARIIALMALVIGVVAAYYHFKTEEDAEAATVKLEQVAPATNTAPTEVVATNAQTNFSLIPVTVKGEFKN